MIASTCFKRVRIVTRDITMVDEKAGQVEGAGGGEGAGRLNDQNLSRPYSILLVTGQASPRRLHQPLHYPLQCFFVQVHTASRTLISNNPLVCCTPYRLDAFSLLHRSFLTISDGPYWPAAGGGPVRLRCRAADERRVVWHIAPAPEAPLESVRAHR